MKVELVQFYVKDDCLCLYTMGKNTLNVAQSDRRLGLYMGENDEHVYILPLIAGAIEGDSNPKPRIIVGSVYRFVKDTVVLQEPEDHVAETFADMIYQGGSRLE